MSTIAAARGGVLGTEAAAAAAPDGYTLLIISIAHAVNPALYKLNYDPIKSFTPIPIWRRPERAGGQSELPVRDVKELLALAQEKPGALDYASAAWAASAFRRRTVSSSPPA